MKGGSGSGSGLGKGKRREEEGTKAQWNTFFIIETMLDRYLQSVYLTNIIFSCICFI